MQKNKFWARADKAEDGCWLWRGAKFTTGYGVVIYEGRQIMAHRRAWQLAHGPIPEGLIICHKCDVKLCVNPDHLFLGTHLDNMRDKMDKGRGYFPGVRNQPRGDNHPARKHPERMARGEAWQKAHTEESRRKGGEKRRKITSEQVIEARNLYAGGVIQTAIAERFGVSISNISLIVRGKSRQKWD